MDRVDISRGFLHAHPVMQAVKGLDDNHVIVDRSDWNKARDIMLTPKLSIEDRASESMKTLSRLINVDKLTNILKNREQEIADGKNAMTSLPMYVVISRLDRYVSGHDEFSGVVNLAGDEKEHGYIDEALDSELREFELSDDGMETPAAVTKVVMDDIKAFFFTRMGADEYTKYQSHNLSKPYVYTFHMGYSNREMEEMLKF